MRSRQMKKGSVKNKVVWITGASAGIGEALAVEAARQGAHVVLSARREQELMRVQARCKQEAHAHQHVHSQFLVLPMDALDHAACTLAYEQVIKCFQRVDWLINNAGLSQRSLILETSNDVDEQIMQLDYHAPVRLTKLVLPQLIQQKEGHVVMISSVAALVGTQYRASYAAAKAALHLWADSLRAEMVGRSVQVHVVFPGFVHTNVSINALTGDGSALGSMDAAQANAMSADAFARLTWQQLLCNNPYIVIGGAKERLAALLSRVSPPLLYKMIAKAKVR